MSKTLSMAVAAALVAFAGVITTLSAKAADISTDRHVAASNRYCLQFWRCGPSGCNWHPVCTRPCPDGTYTCSPLYGAYGPYGGVSFWGAYTDAGWAYR